MKKVTQFLIMILLVMGVSISAKAQEKEVIVKKISFMCNGSKIVGNLFIAKKYKNKKNLPALIIVGPATGIKEQVAGVYAEKMAKKGYITLAFDHRGYGESEGNPRTTENIFDKSDDIKSAISYINSLEQVNSKKVGAVGICAGGGYVTLTAVGDRRLAAVATVSGTLSYKGLVTTSGGDALLQTACNARQLYDETGKATNIPIIMKPSDNSNVFANEAYQYYVENQSNYPTWENSVAIASFSNLASLDIKKVIASLKQPVLFVAGSKAVTLPLSKTAYENAIISKSKKIYQVKGATHISLYHNEKQIDEACNELDNFFRKNLKNKTYKFQKWMITKMVGLKSENVSQQTSPKNVKLTETVKDGVSIRKVSFQSKGTKIYANLYIPSTYKQGEKLPAVLIVGPATSVKEQVQGDYAFRLAKEGFVTFVFDHRTYGESDGFPRCSEDLIIKSEDIRSAISYLASVEQVDANRIAAVGICAGGGYLVETAPGETRLKAIATISGTLSSKKVIEDMPGADIIVSLSNDARQKKDLKNEAIYMRLFAKKRPKLSRKKSKQKISKFQQEAYDYYVSNSDKHPLWRPDVYLGEFSNIAAFDIPTAVKAIKVPKLVIAGTEAYTAPLSQNAYDAAKGDKELFWINGATHVSLYYNKEYMDKVTKKLTVFFNEKL